MASELNVSYLFEEWRNVINADGAKQALLVALWNLAIAALMLIVVWLIFKPVVVHILQIMASKATPSHQEFVQLVIDLSRRAGITVLLFVIFTILGKGGEISIMMRFLVKEKRWSFFNLWKRYIFAYTLVGLLLLALVVGILLMGVVANSLGGILKILLLFASLFVFAVAVLLVLLSLVPRLLARVALEEKKNIPTIFSEMLNSTFTKDSVVYAAKMTLVLIIVSIAVSIVNSFITGLFQEQLLSFIHSAGINDLKALIAFALKHIWEVLGWVLIHSVIEGWVHAMGAIWAYSAVVKGARKALSSVSGKGKLSK